MNDTSPHSSNDDHSSEPNLLWPRFLWFFIGTALGAAPPLLLGAYHVSQFSAYNATLPPDVAVCGTPLLLPVLLFFFVAPIMALIGGCCALLLVVVLQKSG